MLRPGRVSFGRELGGQREPLRARVGEEALVEQQETPVLDQEGLRIDLDVVAIRHGVGAPAAVLRLIARGLGQEPGAVSFAGEAIARAFVDRLYLRVAGLRRASALGVVADRIEAL